MSIPVYSVNSIQQQQQLENIFNIAIDPTLLKTWFLMIKGTQLCQSEVQWIDFFNKNHQKMTKIKDPQTQLQLSTYLDHTYQQHQQRQQESNGSSSTVVNIDTFKTMQKRLKEYESSNHLLNQVQFFWWTWWNKYINVYYALTRAELDSNQNVNLGLELDFSILDLSSNYGEFIPFLFQTKLHIQKVLRILPSIDSQYQNKYDSNCSKINELKIDSTILSKQNIYCLNPFELLSSILKPDPFIHTLDTNHIGYYNIITAPFIIQLSVMKRSELYLFFIRLKTLSRPKSKFYTCLYNTERILEHAIPIHEMDGSYIQGNSSCCWNIPSLDITDYIPYDWYWEGIKRKCAWLSIDEIKYVASLAGFNCIEECSLFDKKELFITYQGKTSINEWNTCYYFDCVVFQLGG